MNRLYFTISDFCIVPNGNVPEKIADKILEYFVIPLSRVQEAVPFEISVSYSVKGQPSGYRPFWWEKARGRSGRSQHTFGERETLILDSEKGAVDLTCEDFDKNKDALIDALVEHTPYLRIAVYDTFIHCDMRDLRNGRKRLFSSNSASQWTEIKYLD